MPLEGTRDFSVPCLLGGTILVGLSFLMPSLVGQRWNDAMANQLLQASVQYHGALESRVHGAGKSPEDDPSFDEIRRSYLQQQDQLERAQSGGTWWAAWVRGVGLIALIAGAARYVWGRYLT